MKKITTEEAMKIVTDAIVNDESYRMSWQANIAMAYYDCHNHHDGSMSTHFIANEAANNFLCTLTGTVLKELNKRSE